MNILASKIHNKRSPAPVGHSMARPTAASFIKSIMQTVPAILFCALFVAGSAHGQSDGTESQSVAPPKLASPVTLTSGNYQGIWRDEEGVTGEWHAKFDIDDQSIKGTLKIYGVDKYSGDKIRGSTEENADGTLSLDFKTRDGFWKSKAIFDGQLLIGTFQYEFQQRRVQRILKGEWAAQKVPETT